MRSTTDTSTVETRMDMPVNLLNFRLVHDEEEKGVTRIPIKLLDDLSNSLSSSGGGRDDVVNTRATCTPVLARGSIYSLLCGGDGVHSGHQSLNNAILLVNDLDNMISERIEYIMR